MFDNEFTVVQQRIVGGKHLKLVLKADNTSDIIDAIAFNVELEQWPDDSVKRLTAAYRLDINRYRGRETVQLIIEHLEKVS